MAQMITINVYRPEYNPETKKYEDHNPIPPRAKGFIYKCLCHHSEKTFTKSSDFTMHFKSKMHRDYINTYEINTKDLTDANERIKQLQIIVEMKHQRILMLERELKMLKAPAYSYQTELD
jgi:hypothetical protein